MSCIFCEIVNKNIPANIVYEDDRVLVFHDINPKASLHLLVVPKKHIPSLREADQETISYLFQIANQVMQGDYRVQINVGSGAGQEVPHLHLHLLQ